MRMGRELQPKLLTSIDRILDEIVESNRQLN
jgi:hypothetical protein